jgi:hypothetical protein
MEKKNCWSLLNKYCCLQKEIAEHAVLHYSAVSGSLQKVVGYHFRA